MVQANDHGALPQGRGDRQYRPGPLGHPKKDHRSVKSLGRLSDFACLNANRNVLPVLFGDGNGLLGDALQCEQYGSVVVFMALQEHSRIAVGVGVLNSDVVETRFVKQSEQCEGSDKYPERDHRSDSPVCFLSIGQTRNSRGVNVNALPALDPKGDLFGVDDKRISPVVLLDLRGDGSTVVANLFERSTLRECKGLMSQRKTQGQGEKAFHGVSPVQVSL